MDCFETYYKKESTSGRFVDTLDGIADSLPGPYLFINPDEFNNPAEYLTAVKLRLPYPEIAVLNEFGTQTEDILEAGYKQIRTEANSYTRSIENADTAVRIHTTHDFAESSELIWACANLYYDQIGSLAFMDMGARHLGYLYNYAAEVPPLYKQVLLNHIGVQADYLMQKALILERYDYAQIICYLMAKISIAELEYELAEHYINSAFGYAYNEGDTNAQNFNSLMKAGKSFIPLQLKMKYGKFRNANVVSRPRANTSSEYIWNLYNNKDTPAYLMKYLSADKYLLLLTELELTTRARKAV